MAHKVVTVSVSEFAELVGKKRQTVYTWIQKGMPHRMEKGVTRIVPKEGVQWVIEYETWEFQQQRKGKREDLPDEEEEKALTARATRLLREHELLEKTRQVVPFIELRDFTERVFGTFVGVAAGRLQSFERDYIRTRTASEARKLNQRIIRELLAGAQSYADQLDAEASEIEKEAALRAKSAPPAPDPDDNDDA